MWGRPSNVERFFLWLGVALVRGRSSSMKWLAAGVSVLQCHGACSHGYENPPEGEQSNGACRPCLWQIGA